jgi:C4-dicarboxylate-specific signal transduction histidine kinase
VLLEERVKDRTKELSKANESLLSEIETRHHAEEMLEEKRSQLAHFSRISVMGRLSGELAHELNQPLNAIQNYVGSLAKIVSSSSVTEAASNILTQLNKEISRAAKIIRRTREFVSTGQHQSESLNLSELVSDTAAMLKGEARRRGMTIQVVDRLGKVNFMGDPVRLQQVLVNLVLNGLESMLDKEDSEKIAILEISNTPEIISIAVHDSGCGVAVSERARLFDAFFTTKATGLGMGLAISRGIVEDHGGRLNYRPRESGGSTFLIELPI